MGSFPEAYRANTLSKSLRKKRRTRLSQLGRATLSAYCPLCVTDAVPGLADERGREWRWESCSLVAGWQVDVQEGRSLCVVRRTLRHYLKITWKLGGEEVVALV